MKTGKRSGPPSQKPSKRRKLDHGDKSKSTKHQPTKNTKAKGKEKAADRLVIPIPEGDQDSSLSDQDVDLLNGYGSSVAFLGRLDEAGISRSKKETIRLHQMSKPRRQKNDNDDLPSVNSDVEDDGSWTSGIDDDFDYENEDDDSDVHLLSASDSDTEMPYETAPRISQVFQGPKQKTVQRLPIKLTDGRVQELGIKSTIVDSEDSEDDVEEEEESRPVAQSSRKVDDVSTGARFGRAAIVDVITRTSRKARIQEAKHQIAGICQDIISDPESSLGLLRRLHVFSLEHVSSPTHPDPVPNDPLIRKLAMLSQLAVFVDIIPGYRIRSLTDKEKAENVSQQVAKTRDWEQGLVGVYQSYLRVLEAESKARGELTEIALQCMCTLLTSATHFNFRINLMGCIIGRLSKKSWDNCSDLCLDSIIKVFRADLTGEPSLELVRLINRMVKERRYNVNPKVLSCLPFLRLKTELGVRASNSKADKDVPTKGKLKRPGPGKRKPGDAPHLSKKVKKTLKERKEIEREFREAEAEVDIEERSNTQTETLKLLFVLYFSILKFPTPTALLPAALEGVSKFAHLVNVDFFKDLLQVLKGLIERDTMPADEESTDEIFIHHRLLCIITAFDLLSGQGEALNIDLGDFITHLYALLQPLSLMPSIHSTPPGSPGRAEKSLADKLFRALNVIFSPRTLGTTAPSWRSAAFAKRLLGAAFHWPPAVTLRTLNFVSGLLLKDEKLQSLLFTEERSLDGVYRSDIDDPQLCNPFGTTLWELYALRDNYCDASVRAEAQKLLAHAYGQ
ncbi:nucleolar complex-associated protein-domain-containing protein [Desarmillaria tabescens]|uniref:Nucleolar complex-associated protein 3 n=1 Tax=Armillaria tabescens TaxID=1929756 RepID=A0AA39N6B2_ARMTA|nr:nucleolar complex-associated protein-domain-containing protein [Desarmillaria tabescens]KAK0459691.1 nucleolar complex-associated protein-domain-containing protein [Desarmillaria tabescens]